MGLGCCCNDGIDGAIERTLVVGESDTECGPLGPSDFGFPTSVAGEVNTRLATQSPDPDVVTDGTARTGLEYRGSVRKLYLGDTGQSFDGFLVSSQSNREGAGGGTPECRVASVRIHGPISGTILYYNSGTLGSSFSELPTPDSNEAVAIGDSASGDYDCPGVAYVVYPDPKEYSYLVFIAFRTYETLSFPLTFPAYALFEI